MQIIKYTANGINLDARIEDGHAWVTYDQTATFFGVAISTVKEHVAAIIAESELSANCRRNFRLEVAHGSSSRIVEVSHVNEDMVAHVGYRVRSDRGTEFRRCVTARLKGELEQLPVKAPTLEEHLLMSAQAMLEQRRILDNHEQRVASLEQHQANVLAEADQALALPPATVDVSGRTQGQAAVALMKAWAVAHAGAFDQAHRMFYGAVLERPETRIDLRRRLEFAKANKERGQKALRLCDIIDASGKAPEIYAIARQLFADEKAA